MQITISTAQITVCGNLSLYIYTHINTHTHQIYVQIHICAYACAYIICVYICARVLSRVLTLCDMVDYSPPGSSVHGVSREEYWSGMSSPLPGDLLNPGLEPMSLTSPVLTGFFTIRATICSYFQYIIMMVFSKWFIVLVYSMSISKYLMKVS